MVDNDYLEQRKQRLQERRVWDPIFNKLTIDVIPAQLSENDIRNILSVPTEKRDELYRVHDAETVYQYIPRVYDDFTISNDRARDILCLAVELALHERLKKIDGYVSTFFPVLRADKPCLGYSYAHLTDKKLADGRWQYTVYYWRGQDFTLPDFLKDLPIITACEDEADGPLPGFRWERLALATIDPDLGRKPDNRPASPNTPPQEPFAGIGSIGFMGVFDRGDVQTNVVVTVGHVIDTNDEGVCIIGMTPDLTRLVELQPIDECKREWDDDFAREGRRKPRFRKTRPFNPCLDEICLLSMDGLPEDHPFHSQFFEVTVHCNSFYTIPPELRSTIPDYMITRSPRLADNVSHLIKSLRNIMPIAVYKHGVGTGVTAGVMFATRPYSRCNRNASTIDNDDDGQGLLSKQDDLQCIVIKWLSANEPFADEGDSGSLVFAMLEEQVVPVGIHFGSDRARYESYAYLLWYWCAELENSLDGELLFRHSDCSRRELPLQDSPLSSEALSLC
jgi:hypothetical protein